jgi:hypothetical protein
MPNARGSVWNAAVNRRFGSGCRRLEMSAHFSSNGHFTMRVTNLIVSHYLNRTVLELSSLTGLREAYCTHISGWGW